MYEVLRTIHLIAVLPCLLLGAYLIYFSKKGSDPHKSFGKIYMALMTIQAFVSLFMEAHVGPQWMNHFGWIHLLSVLTLYTIPVSLRYLRKGNIKSHRCSMVILYWSGLIVAGAFTLTPGRYLHGILF